MRSVTPSIESAVSRLAPGFRALSIVVESAPVADPAVAEQALAEACLAVQQDDVPWAQAHLAAWDEAFSAFGAKAKRTPCSAQALRKRVLKEGSLPSHRSGGGYLQRDQHSLCRPGRWGKSGRLPWRTAAGHCPRR